MQSTVQQRCSISSALFLVRTCGRVPHELQQPPKVVTTQSASAAHAPRNRSRSLRPSPSRFGPRAGLIGARAPASLGPGTITGATDSAGVHPITSATHHGERREAAPRLRPARAALLDVRRLEGGYFMSIGAWLEVSPSQVWLRTPAKSPLALRSTSGGAAPVGSRPTERPSRATGVAPTQARFAVQTPQPRLRTSARANGKNKADPELT